MKINDKSVEFLNKQLTNELTAINQYYVHAKMYSNWGFEKLGKIEYKEAIDEMKHADQLMERILFMEGLPNVQDMHKIGIGENVQECIASDLELEKVARQTLIDGITCFEGEKDYVSRDLFMKLLEDTEHHIDYLETQLEIISKVGIQNYLQTQIEPSSGA